MAVIFKAASFNPLELLTAKYVNPKKQTTTRPNGTSPIIDWMNFFQNFFELKGYCAWNCDG